MHYALINGHPGGGGGGSILPGNICGRGSLDLLTIAANFLSAGWGIGLLLQFYSRIPGERPPGFVMYQAVNGWERE